MTDACAAIAAALRAAGFSGPFEVEGPLGGSGWCEVRAVRAGGEQIVAKVASVERDRMLADEADGLAALAAAHSVHVPRVIGQSAHDAHSVLLMSRLMPACREPSPTCWAEFGEALARLHLHAAPPRYGYSRGNHLGGSRQINDWRDDWARFNAECRLGPQVEWATRNGHLTKEEDRVLRAVMERLPALVPARPGVSLLHGDLWSGNALACTIDGEDTIGVIDPACSYGDALADMAMMQLFGGFPRAVFDAWEAAMQRSIIDELPALRVYQLYHVLNHVNLFGRGYAGQAMALAKSLV